LFRGSGFSIRRRCHEIVTYATRLPSPGGYGYQVWLLPGERRMFLLLGISGQGLFVDPESKLIMVQTALRKLPVGIAGSYGPVVCGRGATQASLDPLDLANTASDSIGHGGRPGRPIFATPWSRSVTRSIRMGFPSLLHSPASLNFECNWLIDAEPAIALSSNPVYNKPRACSFCSTVLQSLISPSGMSDGTWPS
jgi:hypothetical protein